MRIDSVSLDIIELISATVKSTDKVSVGISKTKIISWLPSVL